MRPRLVEPHLRRQQGEAVASRPREQDAREIEGVQDLLRFVPQPRRVEKLDVEPGAMADWLPSADELGQPAQGGLRAGRSPQLLLLDPGEAQHGVRHRAAGIDQLFQGGGDLVGGEGDGPDFDDSVSSRVETGRLEVQGSVFRQLFSDSTNPDESGSELESRTVICAPDGNRGDRGSQASGRPSRQA